MDQAILRHEVKEIEFGFYEENEIRQLSVKKIESPISFDSMGHAVLGGLYDPALGPIDFNMICPTCHMTQKDCPGHLGHIELPVPVYHPVLFMTMFNILKRKCFSCHKFRMNSQKVREYRIKVLLLDHGYVDEAKTLSMKLGQKNGDFEEDKLSETTRMVRLLDEYEQMVLRDGHKYVNEKLPHAVTVERLDTIHGFLGSMTKSKCDNCGGMSPGLRQDGHAKVFLKPFGARQIRMNRKNAANFVDAVDDTVVEDEAEEYVDSDDDAPVDESKAKFLPPAELLSQMELLWKKEKGIMELFWGKREMGIHMDTDKLGFLRFFMHVVPVAPSRFRPPVMMGDKQFEHSQNTYLGKILQLSEQMLQGTKSRDGGEEQALNLSNKIMVWVQLQENVNQLMDNSTAKRPQDVPQGIRQIIEKKEGLFRKHMMGKRVNYSARSVISPDPYIGSSEIGVPLRFAKKLTYPQPVTSWNVDEMRQLIINGAEVHPGANFVENEQGMLIDLSKRSAAQRKAISKTLLIKTQSAGSASENNGKRVWRHLQSGDVVLMNRQPTLHKPSMMAHITRVLTNPELQTIRMHYVNCNTFNADFDGDEMNMHFPQNELARAEAYHIASNDYQYIVPTDGSPLRGLIQDHVDSGVKLTNRETFLDKDMYTQLLFSAWTCMDHLGVDRGHIETIAPCILKPKKLWSGKQVISTLLLQLTKGYPGLNLNSKTRLKEVSFGKDNAEHIVIFRDCELLQGVLDKSQFGASEHGLVHSVYEIYGARMAADLLTALGRLFTTYLQYAGHTCALEDLTLTTEAEDHRKQLVNDSVLLGQKAYADFAGVESVGDDLLSDDERKLVRERMEKMRAGDVVVGVDHNAQMLDSKMMQCVHKSNSDIIKACLPAGQSKPFPANAFSLMVLTGAKGSMVNHSQISCGLGQQALEGRRVPVLVSGRSLPSFEPYDPSPRAGGYITDRFLTGLRPQEYYHHCMAGREGLVDTAVKTSRSGYLQRCLVKHLEDLTVGYDHTVRNTNGNVIQFLYGEDGIDPVDSALLTGENRQMTFLAMNHASMSHKYGIDGDFFNATGLDMMEPVKHNRVISRVRRSIKANKFKIGEKIECRKMKDRREGWKRGNIEVGWFDATVLQVYESTLDVKYEASGLICKALPHCVEIEGSALGSSEYTSQSGNVILVRSKLPDPIMHALPLNKHVGVVSERLQDDITSYTNSNPDNVLASKKPKKKSKSQIDDENCTDGSNNRVSPGAFELLMWVKYLRSLCQPGENVGTIAAQSIGEPSTQMTLNTFHLAGHGAANVTLGIPRLREIIMTASPRMNTPAMTVPLLPKVSRDEASKIEQRLNRTSLKALLSNEKGICVVDELQLGHDQLLWERQYCIKLKFFDLESILAHFGIAKKHIHRSIGMDFATKLISAVNREFKRSGIEPGFIESVNDIEAVEESTHASKFNEEDDEEQGTLTFGAKREVSGYGEMDEEDKAVAKSPASPEDSESEQENDDDDLPPLPGSLAKRKAAMLPRPNSAKKFREIPVGANVQVHGNFAGCFEDESDSSIHLYLHFPADFKKLLLIPIVEQVVAQVFVRQCPGITRSVYIKQRLEPNGDEVPCIQTEGLNFGSIWEMDHLLDVNRLHTNDIYQILKTYGVEAARASISRQINEVFGVYGISVDARHLSLLSDYMTFMGGYMPLNRMGMKHKGSPFQQITFETSMTFLASAATFGLTDNMESPSAKLILGQPPNLGTGKFTCLQPVSF